MISEPELVGGPDEGPPPETMVSGGGPSRWDRLRERPEGWRRPPWLWALGGAVVASALWAGGLYAFGDRAPDQRGYRIGADACDRAGLAALTSALGRRNHSVDAAAVDEDPARTRAECTVVIEPSGSVPGNGAQGNEYRVELIAVQHRRTDPGPEFEASLRDGGYGGETLGRPTSVPGLGDRAYRIEVSDIAQVQRLAVLDGGVVLTLEVLGFREGPVDLEGGEAARIQGLMEQDMRTLMSELKK